MFGNTIAKIALGVGGTFVVSLVLLLAYQTNRVDRLTEERDTAQAAAAASEKTILALGREQAFRDEVQGRLSEIERTVQANTRAQTQFLAALRERDEAAREYLDTPVPPSVAGIVWGDGEDRDDPAFAPRGTSAGLQGGRPPAREPGN
jgi:hypothetical protein